MHKVLKYVFSFVVSICFITSVKAYNVSSNNNPGTNYNNSGASLSGTTTIWPSPYLKVVRIRIFRGNTAIGDKYYSIVNNENSCYSGVSSVKVCESSGYNYSKVTDSNGVSCTEKDLSFGCIATSNLNSSWGVDSYNGTYLDNYLKNTNYINLKSILEGMGYNNTNFQNDDIVIVEPATLVKCAGKLYFGTSTALMKKNVSYRGSSGNQCSSKDSFNGYTFQNVFQSMSTAFKQTNCSSATKSSYDGCGYFKYNVSDLGYFDPYGDIIVSIVDSSGALINTTAKFKLVKGDNCDTGVFVDKKDTGISGTINFKNLNLEQYSVCQEQHPDGYKETPISDGGVKQTGTLTSSGLNFTFIYEKDCTAKLNDLGSNPTILQLLNLYNEYPSFNNLLNFDNPSCSVKDCNSITKLNEALITNCLTATGEASAFTEKDLSCHDDVITDIYENYIGFCKNTLDLKNNLGVNKFYANAGQFLIHKTSSNIYKIYDENLNQVEINSQYLATATLKKECYILNGSTISVNEELPTISLYFNDEENELNYDKVDNTPSVSYNENFTKYTYSTKYNYKLNNIYLEKLTGKVLKQKSDLTTDALFFSLTDCVCMHTHRFHIIKITIIICPKFTNFR